MPATRLTTSLGRLMINAGRWVMRYGVPAVPPRRHSIGLALGGGFARGIAHVGVLRVFEENSIPIAAISGVSAGAIAAAAFASGVPTSEIEKLAAVMRFRDVARLTVSRMGLVSSERMQAFLQRLLAVTRFEEMKIPLAIVATDLRTGEPRVFRGPGDVIAPIRASCSYPGLFLPLEIEGRYLVDGAISTDVPSQAARDLRATRVVSVALPAPHVINDPRNMLHVVNRCFQILQAQTEYSWRRYSDLVIEPDVRGFAWDAYESAAAMIEAGRRAAEAALPSIQAWLSLGEKNRG
ncbi:MAG: patatin-like phospholipase family protein [Bryobacteraceae bacterium]